MTETVHVVTLLQRRTDLTHEEFCEHWRTIHAPLACALPGLLAYAQTDVTHEIVPHPDSEHPAESLVPDGIAELTFATWEDRGTAYASPEGRTLMADGVLFVGASRSFVVGARVSFT